MKILQVVHGFPPESRAGTEIYTYILSKELSRNHEVHVFYPRGPCSGEHDSDLHIVEHEAKIGRNRLYFSALNLLSLKHTYKNIKVEREFKALLDEINPDIVHFQHLMNLSVSLIELVKQRGIPSVLTLHDFWFVCPSINLLRSDCSTCDGPDADANNCCMCCSKAIAEYLTQSLGRDRIPKVFSRFLELGLMALRKSKDFKQRQEYLKSLLLKVDKLIAPSMFLRNIFVQNGIPDDKIICSSNGYDVSKFEGFKKRGKDRLVFGYAGAVAKHKGVHVLIEAFNKLEDSNLELRIYGNYDPHSNYFKNLKSMIRSDNIKFMGRYTDVREPHSNMDVLVVPSIWYETGGPLVIIEALIAKTPVIASNIGCIPEFIQHDKTGLLFQAGNARDLYQKMELIIHHPDLIEKFKTNIGPVKSIEQQAEEMEGIYLDLLMSKHE
jgi:glycosyltransferase involved in cell wall biosynthesis